VPAVTHRHEWVTTRDGVRLATDVYLPGSGARVPAVLQRTPYGKLGSDPVRYAEWCARAGYACVVQDVRGRHDSDGVWEPYGLHETADGHDTIDWITRQPWSLGPVAGVGASYGAFAAYMAALAGHPALKALVTRVPATGLYHRHFYYGGVFSLARLAWGTGVNRRVQQETPAWGASPRSVFEVLLAEDPEILLHLPVAEIGDRFPMRVPWWRTWVAHQTEDEYWRAREVIHRIDQVRVPVYHVGGWHDDFVSVPLANFTAAGPAAGHRLLMGMWPHALNERTDHGGVDYGPDAVIDLWGREKGWLDHWLLGRPDPLAAEPPVRLFVMGADAWRAYARWPPETTEERALYLRADQRLSFTPPAAEPPDGYRYDPAHPTPPPWDFGEPDLPAVPGWALDPGPRADRALYASEPLPAPLTVVGSVVLRLYAASSARDTDWFAWVGWEDPATRRQRLLTYGYCLRARFRKGFDRPEPLEPGVVERYEIDLGATARVLPAGARLLCCVQSSCAPWFSRNLNTGGDNYRETETTVAEQSIHHDRARPSAVVLRVEPSVPVSDRAGRPGRGA
jgi:putative CocE/NonD family hydrolase